MVDRLDAGWQQVETPARYAFGTLFANPKSTTWSEGSWTMPVGTIAKVVRMISPAMAVHDRSSSEVTEGYGIIAGKRGGRIFFVDSAVVGTRFVCLVSGQRVRYTLEEGPLARAACVSPVRRKRLRRRKPRLSANPA